MSRKSMVITGAARGIGRMLARELIRRNKFDLLLVDIDGIRLREEFPDESNHILLKDADVSQAKDWEEIKTLVKHEFPQLDFLVNNAAVITPGWSYEIAPEDIERQVDVNIKSVMLGTRYLGRLMVKQGSGHIINIASLAGLAPVPGIGIYSATKFAVRGFSLACALEMKEKGVHVTAICPDLVDTDMLDLQLDYEEAAITFSGKTQPLKPEDVVKAIIEAMDNHPLEVGLPASRRMTARLAGMFPSIAMRLLKPVRKKGIRQMKDLKEKRKRYGS